MGQGIPEQGQDAGTLLIAGECRLRRVGRQWLSAGLLGPDDRRQRRAAVGVASSAARGCLDPVQTVLAEEHFTLDKAGWRAEHTTANRFLCCLF